MKSKLIEGGLGVGWLLVITCGIIDFYWPNDYYWFQRVGAMLCALSVVAEFELGRHHPLRWYNGSALDFETSISISNGEKGLTKYEKTVRNIAHGSLVFGTVVWAYGDLPIKWWFS